MYYVYMLADPTTMIPFYIGVAKSNRKSNYPREYQHIVEAKKYAQGKNIYKPNLHKIRKILKIIESGLEPIITTVATFEDPDEAFKEEIRLIKHYGRADLNQGPLTNLTDGGQGGLNVSPETKRKLSEKRKGKPSPLKGRKLGTYSEERRKNISKATQGRISPKKGKKTNMPAWNKGLTKHTSESVAKYSVPNPNKGFKKGHKATNKGKIYVKDLEGNTLCVEKDDERIISGELRSIFENRIPPTKGMTLSTKGKTYEELYGPEKAAELREKRRQTNLRRWANRAKK